MSFNFAQNFFVDPSGVKNAPEVGITKIDLYFRAKPPQNNNKSGIDSPGVEVKIVPTINGVPMFDEVGVVRPTEPTEHGAKFAFYSTGSPARREWIEIIPSVDASIATEFKFKNPYFVKTNQEYAILVKFDGNEDFILWNSVSGNPLLGTQSASSGPSGQNVGNLFQYIGKLNPAATLANTVGNVPSNLLNTTSNTVYKDDSKYYLSNLSPITNTSLKFKIYVARYFNNGAPITANSQVMNNPFITKSTDLITPTVNAQFSNTTNSYVITAPADKLEYITYDRKFSVLDNPFFGELVYQNQPFYPGAGSANNSGGANAVCTVSTVSNTTGSDIVTANGSYILSNGATFNNAGGFNNIFTQANDDEYIIITSGDKLNVRRVVEIVSNTQIRVDSPITFTNTVAKFFKSPVAAIYSVGDSYFNGQTTSLLTLNKSNANATSRFVNNSIESISIVSGGTGYSNSDYIVISGYESVANKVLGGYNATANIITNGSGTITQVMVTNSGAGFVNTSWLTGSNVIIANSTGGNSVGSSASFTYNIGATLKTEFSSTNYFGNCSIINIPANRIKPEITVNNPLGTAFNVRLRTLFYEMSDNTTFSGKVYRINSPSELVDTPIKIFKNHTINVSNTAVLPSRSNEFVIPYSNGSLANTSVLGVENSNSVVMFFDVASNNDFTAPFIDPDITRNHFANYLINNDYTNEHTNYGAAFSKHVTTKVNFAQGRFAEDLLAYLTAYRPQGTDIKVYARVHNSKDPEAFDDKDWTLLELIDGVDAYSSKDNTSDYVELTYNFTQYPNTEYTLAGTATVYQGQLYVVGSNTAFNNSSVFALADASTVNNATDFIAIANHPFANNDQVQYILQANKTGITGLSNGTIYYVVQANSSGIKLATTKGGANVNISSNTTNATFNSGSGVNNTTDFITISSNPFVNNDIVRYVVSAGNTAIGGLTNNSVYYVVQANSTGVKLSATSNGSAIDISNNGVSETGHTLSSGSGQIFYRTAVVPDDLIKIYSPLFPTNYAIHAVDSVVNSTYLTIKRSFGDLSANLAGTISVNTTATTFDGVNTTFTSDFVANDFIAVWSNSSVYEVRQIVSITDANTLVVSSPFTFANSTANYAIVESNDFVNNSISVSGNRIDRLAFKHQAFNYQPNENVVRYYNTSMVQFDGFDTFQLKIVLLSNNNVIVPRVDDVRGVGVSA